MGHIANNPGGSEPGAAAGGGVPYIRLTGRLDPSRLALINVILARPDVGLFEQLNLEELRRQDLPDGSDRLPGVLDTGATVSSITPDLVGSLGLQEDGGQRKIKVPTDPEGKWEPTYAAQLVLGGAFYIVIPVTANLFPPEGQTYKMLIGCDVLRMCRLTYEGPEYLPSGGDAGGYTLHVPDSRRLAT